MRLFFILRVSNDLYGIYINMFSLGSTVVQTGVSVTTDQITQIQQDVQKAFERWSQFASFPSSLGAHKIVVNLEFAYDNTTNWLAGAYISSYTYVDSNTSNNALGNKYPSSGKMTFNMAYGQPSYGVIVHEIGHILGIGPMWNTTTNTLITNLIYTGTHAYREYKSYLKDAGFDTSGIIGIPVEDDGGVGTAYVHLEEDAFGILSTKSRIYNGVYHPGLWEEIMTGYANKTMYLSRISIGLLEDLGYVIRNYRLADAYRIKRESIQIQYKQRDFVLNDSTLTSNGESVPGRWLSDYKYTSNVFSNGSYMLFYFYKNGVVLPIEYTGTMIIYESTYDSTFSSKILSGTFNDPSNRGKWIGKLLDGTLFPKIRLKMTFDFNHSSHKFYKKNSLAPCGVGSARNSRLKSRKT